eukprot:TRINITY_DN66730_c0_g1_i1.p1 TRINITY_DN66730_c0_g1~~TRINITY_DN66730_c0_g1_i1.p1  ORF type:complete len:473 (+),score=46.37 TRINITY_DN66730_c0_g1_i1:49-1467(+)
MDPEPSAATLKRRRRAAAKAASAAATASETEEESPPISDKSFNFWDLRINKATGRYERGTSAQEAKDDELDGIEEEEDTREPTPNAIRWLASDVAEVASNAKDLTLAAKLISPFAGSLMQMWTHADWQLHSSRMRFWWHCRNWFMSTVLKRIKIPVLTLVIFSVLIRLINEQLGGVLSVPLAAVTLQGASIGLLLVFRTNSASARVSEARTWWGALARHCVTIADVLHCYVDTSQHADAVAEVGRLLASLGFLLKAGLRCGEASMPLGSGGAHDAARVLLGEDLAEWVLHGNATRTAHRNKARQGLAPYRRALLRLRQLLRALPLGRKPLEQQNAASAHYAMVETEAVATLSAQLDGLTTIGGGCFKQFTTPIPPTYQRHVTRGMLIWLAALPLALPRDMGYWPVIFAVASTAYLILGIDEIAIQHEEAFAVLPLHEISVGNARTVASSLASRPPLLPACLRCSKREAAAAT